MKGKRKKIHKTLCFYLHITAQEVENHSLEKKKGEG